jgi:inhibitor of cysteine peptidase
MGIRKGESMSNRLWKWMGLLAIILAVVACSARSQAGSTTTSLREKDAGRRVQLKQGDTLIIELQGNPSTGFSWEAASVDTAVLEVEGDPEFEAETPNLVGSGGTFTFTFKASGTGQTELQMIYHRPWEKDVPAANRFEVTVVVD